MYQPILARGVYSKKLTDHPGMQCEVLMDDRGNIMFKSYNTIVLQAIPRDIFEANKKDLFDEDIDLSTTVISVYNYEEFELTDYVIIPTGLFYDGERVFTPTTAKQLSYFLREYFPNVSYQDYKKTCLWDSKSEESRAVIFTKRGR